MTGWSWKLGRVAGIDVYMHVTFLMLLAWVGVSHYLERHDLADAGAGVVFILALFAIVVWMGAASEASAALTQSVLGGIPVSQVMITRFETLAPTDTLQRALAYVLEGAVQRLQASGCPALAVVGDRRLVGILTMENVGEFIMVHSALRANVARADVHA